MLVAETVAEQMAHASWVRKAFAEAERLRKERGSENVYDYSLGNPEVEPPAEVLHAFRRIAYENLPGSHRYMSNAGFPQVREAVAEQMRKETGLDFTADDIIMTSGAAGACNILLKSILDPGDEVIVLSPFFPEYAFYITNHGGRMALVETDEDFLPDVERIAAAITPRTKAILLNTPNNPTGRVYPESILRDLQTILFRLPHSVMVISDEPYKHLVFDGKRQPEVARIITHTAICYSASKSKALPGERIGYLALSPLLTELASLRAACTFANRILGFVNASAFWQLVLAGALDAAVDVSLYQRKRDLLCDADNVRYFSHILIEAGAW